MRKMSGSKKKILAMGIAIVFFIFIAYAIEAFYPGPNYEDYCRDNLIFQVNSEVECLNQNGTWLNYSSNPYPKPIEENITGYCDFYSKCSEDYNLLRESYNRNVFFLTLIIGIIIFLISIYLIEESVSTGLMSGSLLLIVYGTIRYWGFLSDILRTILLGIVLLILIWIGYKKLK